MPNLLTELAVEWVSLVDRAAVRDPQDPTQPQRFLLAKSDVPVWKSDRVSEMDQLLAAVAKAEEERDIALASMESIGGEHEQLADRLEKLEDKRRNQESNSEGAEMTSIEKTSNVSEAGRGAIHRAIQVLAPYKDEELVGGLVSKMTEIASAEPLSKSETQLREILKASAGLELADRVQVGKATRESQLAYLRSQSPAGAAAWERGDTVPDARGDSGAVFANAEQVRKASPDLSDYKAVERAMRNDPAGMAAYLEAVR